MSLPAVSPDQTPPLWSLFAPEAGKTQPPSGGDRFKTVVRRIGQDEYTVKVASNPEKTSASTSASTSAGSSEGKGVSEDKGGQEDGFSFGDLLDIVNPLQHIPIVSTIYREVTGDTIGPVARIVGGTIFGGPVGFATSALDAGFASATGKDVGETVVAMITGDEGPSTGDGVTDAPVQVAENMAARAETAAAQDTSGQVASNDVNPLRTDRPAPTFFHLSSTRNYRPTPKPEVTEQDQKAMQALMQAEKAVPMRDAPSPLKIAPGTANAQQAQVVASETGFSTPRSTRDGNIPMTGAFVNGSERPEQVAARAPAPQSANIMNLSPGVAQQLMLMSQQSQGVRPAAGPTPQGTKQSAPAPSARPVNAAPAPVPAPAPAPILANADATDDGGAADPAFGKPIPADQVPQAMLNALKKYEAMRSN